MQVIERAAIDHVFLFMQNCFASPLLWFETLLTSTGLTSFWIACVFIFIVGKFILAPLFGSSLGSDKAHKKDDSDG